MRASRWFASHAIERVLDTPIEGDDMRGDPLLATLAGVYVAAAHQQRGIDFALSGRCSLPGSTGNARRASSRSHQATGGTFGRSARRAEVTIWASVGTGLAT